MKIKLSKKQWQEIGKTAGWMKTAQSDIVPIGPQRTLNSEKQFREWLWANGWTDGAIITKDQEILITNKRAEFGLKSDWPSFTTNVEDGTVEIEW